MVQKSSDIVNEQRVKQFSDLLSVGKVQSTLERDPIYELELYTVALDRI